MTLICKKCKKESEVELGDPYCLDCDPTLKGERQKVIEQFITELRLRCPIIYKPKAKSSHKYLEYGVTIEDLEIISRILMSKKQHSQRRSE